MLTSLQSVLRTSPNANCRWLLHFKSSYQPCPVLQGKQFHSVALCPSYLPDKYCSSGRAAAPVLQVTQNNMFLSAFCGSVNGTGAFSWTQNFSTSAHLSAKELSEKGDVVYRGAISGMIKGVKIFSLSTSVIGICLQPTLLFSNQELPTGLKIALGGFINFLVFMNPFIIHYIAKKYVTELRWNRRTGVFTAVTLSFLVQRKEVQFSAEDVRVPDVPGMFTFLEAKGTPLFMDPQAFVDNEAYIRLMGFDKPLDWELPQERGPSTKDDSQRR